jgi:hypothetical protein
MFLLNLHSTLRLALLSFAIGFCGSLLLFGNCNHNKYSNSTVPINFLKIQADSIRTIYEPRIASLESRNHFLQLELKRTKEQLSTIKLKAKSKAQTIKKIIELGGYPAKELLKKIEPATLIVANELSPCDSLVQEVSVYLQDTNIKDSLYDAHITIQDNIIAGKDSIISLCNEKQEIFGKILDQSLLQQKQLAKQNLSLQKHLKHQKHKSRFITLGAAILSGLAVNYLTHH